MAKKKIVNQDIYNLSKLVDDVKHQFIPEETEATLSAGTFGYIGAIESKRLQTQAIMTGEMCNESFPSRARLERNVITHAITYDIEDINASPGKMDVILGIRQSDIIDQMKGNRFVLDRECPIYIENFEFHLEYDIIINQITIAGNEQVFTAQYDMSRENPSSDIMNPYIASPAVIVIENEAYIFLNVIIAQVEHDKEYKKVITSNLIDNKTINFDFQNQLAYFEVHVIETDGEVYLTPVFEGAAIPNGVALYCWYQYIDVDKIRVRFDRNSYMPGLNAQIEVLIKTTQGSKGNFPYKVDIVTNFDSDIYGYKNLPILVKPASESDDGKDRKSKKELQRILPAAILSRGSLVNMKDLQNYFSMIDSENGRIVPYRKIDNQRERVFYAYLVLKDVNGNIIPANTIDLKIPISKMIQTSISDSASPRYVLPFGTCFKLSDDGKTGEIVRTPIINLGLRWNTKDLYEGDRVDLKFSVRIISDDYPSVNCRALMDSHSSVYIESPTYVGDTYAPDNTKEPIPFIDGSIVSIGDKIRITHKYIPTKNGNINIKIDLNKGVTYIPLTTEYYKDNSRFPIGNLDPTNIDVKDKLIFTIPNAVVGSEYRLVFDLRINEEADLEMEIPITSSVDDASSVSKLKIRTVKLTLESNPAQLLTGNVLNYKVSYIADKYYPTPPVNIELSRGVTYVVASGVLNINNEGEFNSEPIMSDLSQDAGFLYTNPYSIVINHYHLYSAFYMMCVNEYPYLHFEYINQKSSIQFVATNLSWVRPFLGYNNDTYTMQMMITQSVARDMGIVVKHDEDRDNIWFEYKVKLIGLFYRNGVPYRYKNFELLYDDEQYGYMFQATMHALDILDQENNIKVEDVGLLNQFEEEYGFFNANTTLKLYALAQFPDIEGRYTRYNLDSYVPGLDGWTVTNVYDVVNGVNFYHNYAEIMGSRVSPYGSTSMLNFKAGNADEKDPEFMTLDSDYAALANYFTVNTNESEEMIEMIKGYYNIHELIDITTDSKEEMLTVKRKSAYTEPGESEDEDQTKDIMIPEGYLVASVPVFGYDYCRNEILVNDAIDALNNRKGYIDAAIIRNENSFGIDFKHFNTYGPSKVFYVIKDMNANSLLDDEKVFLDRVNITMNFRAKLVNQNDTYTKNLIIKEVKDYMEDLNELGEIHIPDLITQINQNYSESVVYFEFLGFNDYGPGVQHLFKLPDTQVPIHVCPEFININNVPETVQSNKLVPDINIYISES